MTETPNSWQLLEQLCSIHAVSGREDRLIRFLREYLGNKLNDLHVDRLGNVTGSIAGRRDPETRLLLQAHMDELGLIVRDITDDGFLLFERVGGVPEKSLLGQKMQVLTEDDRIITGIVGPKSHHVTGKDEKFVVPDVHSMFVDVGLTSRRAVEVAGIRVGDPIAYQPNFSEYGDDLICSKALDNRVSIFLLLQVIDQLLQNPPKSTVAFAFTVLEEFSIRGSLPAVQRIRPDAILSLDITVATDTPAETRLHPVRLGHGPAIKMMDFHGRGTLGGLFTSPPLRRFLLDQARELDIEMQREVIIGVITDPAFQLYLGEDGQSIAGLSIPQRYTHASVSVCHKGDIQQGTAVTAAVAKEFDSSVSLERG
jgi:putative aminopeptidase FrvX